MGWPDKKAALNSQRSKNINRPTVSSQEFIYFLNREPKTYHAVIRLDRKSKKTVEVTIDKIVLCQIHIHEPDF